MAMARENIGHLEAGTPLGRLISVVELPASMYMDPERWEREVALFKRLPLMLRSVASCAGRRRTRR